MTVFICNFYYYQFYSSLIEALFVGLNSSVVTSNAVLGAMRPMVVQSMKPRTITNAPVQHNKKMRREFPPKLFRLNQLLFGHLDLSKTFPLQFKIRCGIRDLKTEIETGGSTIGYIDSFIVLMIISIQ